MRKDDREKRKDDRLFLSSPTPIGDPGSLVLFFPHFVNEYVTIDKNTHYRIRHSKLEQNLLNLVLIAKVPVTVR